MPNIVSGKVAIVTGAGRGIGRGIALLMAREGARVVVCDIGASLDGAGTDVGPAQQVVDEIKKAGGKAIASTLSISEPGNADKIVKSALDTFGRVDILVNNAGILRDRTFANTSETDWDAVIGVHLRGAYCVTHPVWTWMKENGKGGVIVLTSSGSGLFGNFGQTNYGAAKAGLWGMMRVLSIEGRKYGIRVWGLAPGAYTRMTSDLPGRRDREPDPASLPENIAPGVLYMVSDLSGDQTGKMLGVSSRGVREIKMVQAKGFTPTVGWTAQDLADRAGDVFFADAPADARG
jgi:NAD(P)-dependent dehydrogenase (short-subunit alcohol dehydrogenase family)